MLILTGQQLGTSFVKRILFVGLGGVLTALASQQSASPSGCELSDLPAPILTHLKTKYTEWEVLKLDDLLPEDRKFYLDHNPGGCPGFTSGEYIAGRKSFAVLIISKKTKPLRVKLLVFVKGGERYNPTTLVDSEHEGPLPAIFTRPPGSYQSWDREEEIKAEHAVIFFVRYEAWALMFYWQQGKWRMLQISD